MRSDKSNLYGSGFDNDDQDKPMSVLDAKRHANGNVTVMGTIVSVSESYFLELPDDVNPTKKVLKRAKSIQLEDTENIEAIERLDVIVYEEMIDDVRAGEVVIIGGKMKVESKKGYGKSIKKFNVIDASFIEYVNRKDVIITERDIKNFYRFASYPQCILCRLVCMFAPHIIGHGPAKLGLLRSAVGSSNYESDKKGKDIDRRIHTLLVGDPGTAKSTLEKEAVNVKPNSRYVSAPHATTKTITAIVEKEGEQFVLRVGAIPLSIGALCGVNEIASFPPEDQGRLLDVMEEGKFPLDKYGHHYEIPAQTTIIGTANPVQGTWSSSQIASHEEIALMNTLVSRFTQIFVFRDKVESPEESRKFVDNMNKIRKRRSHNYNFLTKYLLYASSIKDVGITDEAEYMLNTFWNQAKNTGSLNARMYLGIYRIAEAQAKLQLKNEIDVKIATQVIEDIQFMMSQFGMTGGPVTNPRDMTYSCFLQILQKVKMTTIFELCKTACEESPEVAGFLGTRWSIEVNKKLRAVIDLLYNNNKNVKRIGLCPIVLKWVGDDHENESDLSDLSDFDPNAISQQKKIDCS